MPSIDHRDKQIRLLTPRQAWPRALARNDRRQPKWQEIYTRSPFPSNLLYGRPRTIDRSINNPAGDPEPNPQIPDPHWSPPYPWASFTAHQTINDWVEEQDLTVPPSWFSLTVQAKKDFLAENFG